VGGYCGDGPDLDVDVNVDADNGKTRITSVQLSRGDSADFLVIIWYWR
jgi:hypothetical protein